MRDFIQVQNLISGASVDDIDHASQVKIYFLEVYERIHEEVGLQIFLF